MNELCGNGGKQSQGMHISTEKLKKLDTLYLLRYSDIFVSVVLQKDPRIVALHQIKDIYQNDIFTQ